MKQSIRPILKSALLSSMVASLLVAAPAIAAVPSSTNYEIPWDSVSSAGGLATSTSYVLTDSVAQSTAVGMSFAASYDVNGGFHTSPDTDEDLIIDFIDNCREISNTDQADIDGDGIGDVCDIFTDLIALASIGGSGAPDVGVVVQGASVHVHVRDGSTDALLSDIDFGTDPAYGILVVPDLADAGSDAEIAMLGERPSGQIRAQVKDSATGGSVSNLFYGSQYSGLDMALVSDYGGGGLPELAVLGVNAGNGIRVQTRDIATDTFLDNLFLGSQTTAKGVVSVSDVSGNSLSEVGVMSVFNATAQGRLQVLDADSGVLHTNVFFGNVYTPVELITMPTINGGSAEELVGLGINEVTGGVRVQIRDSGTAAILTNMFLGSANTPVDLAVVSDNNGNGFPEIAVLMETPAGNGIVKVHDSDTGLFIRNVFFNGLVDPVGIVTLPNFGGGTGDELAVLGTNGGVKRVLIKDSRTNAQLNAISFPEP